MPAPVTFRYAAFTFFSVCCLVILALAGTNLSQTKALGASSSIARVDGLLLFNAVSGLFAVFIVVPLERIRPFPATSKLCVEVAWITLFLLFNFAAAVAVTVIGVHEICSPKWTNILPRAACGSASGLQAFSWLATVILLFYVVFISSCAFLAKARVPNVWHMTVLEVEWTAGTKETPVLPTYHEKQVPVYTVGVKPLLTTQKATVALPIATEKPVRKPAPPIPHSRASELITAPPSHTDAPPSYPQISTTHQRAASADHKRDSSSVSDMSLSKPQSGRSSPSSSIESSPLSSPSSAGSGPEASDTSSGRRSGSSSPRMKRRPPPLNLAGLSAFDAANKSKKRQDRK